MLKKIIKDCLQCKCSFEHNPANSGNKRKERIFCSRPCYRQWMIENSIKNDNLIVKSTRLCSICNKTKPILEFPIKSRLDHTKSKYCNFCKNCLYIKQMIRWNSRKIKAITYLGGKCNVCTKIVHPALFDFDHLDPSMKEMDWSKMKNKSFTKIKTEIDKCQLLCSYCHRLKTINHDLWIIPNDYYSEIKNEIKVKISDEDIIGKLPIDSIDEIVNFSGWKKDKIIKLAKRNNYLFINNKLIKKPTILELSNLINTKSAVEIGKIYSVSDKAVKKWLDKFNIKNLHKTI